MKKIAIALTLLLTVVTVSAKTYYAKPNGKGDGSSYDKAGEFTTLVKSLSAGDILYCLGGQYDYSSTISISASGNSSQYVNIWAVDGETPIFDFRKIAYGSRGITTSGNYLYMKGLTIRYTGKNGLLHSGSYSKFEMLDVYGNGDTGVQMKGGHNNLIINCDSHDNFDYELGGTTAADFGGNADGFADKQYTGGGNHYIGCRAWNNSDDGWDFYQHVTGGYGPTVIENCVCYNNGPGEYNMVGHGRYETDKSWFKQFEGNGTTVTSKRDGNPQYTVTLEHYINLGNANGFKLGGGQTNHDVELINSLSVYNGVNFHLDASLGAKGIDQNNNAGEMWIYNNTSCYNAKNYGFDQNKCGTAHLYNNVTYKGVNSDVIKCASYEEKNNSWNISGLALSDGDFVSTEVIESEILAPRQADGSLPEMAFMHLTSTSQLIDKGTIDTELPYYGDAPDLGCFEYTDGGMPHVPATLTLAGLANQSVRAGRAITTTTITAGGSATAIERTDDTVIPGVTVAVDGKVATISGTPTEAGKYVMTFVPTADFETDVKVTVTLNVSEASAAVIAYVTNGTSGTDAADAKILDAIRTKFDVTVFDANVSSNDYSECDAIVISPVPGSNAAAMSGLKNYNLPTLLLKPWMMKSGVWSWGTAANTGDLSVRISDDTHEIFKDVEIDNNNLQLFSSANTNAVTAISDYSGWSGYTTLATPVSNSSYISIADLTGATISGSKINNRYIMIGVSEYSTANLTEAAQKLILNATYYILGMEIPTGIVNVNANDNQNVNVNVPVPVNIAGQKVGKDFKGIVIVNGEKIIR